MLLTVCLGVQINCQLCSIRVPTDRRDKIRIPVTKKHNRETKQKKFKFNVIFARRKRSQKWAGPQRILMTNYAGRGDPDDLFCVFWSPPAVFKEVGPLMKMLLGHSSPSGASLLPTRRALFNSYECERWRMRVQESFHFRLGFDWCLLNSKHIVRTRKKARNILKDEDNDQ